MLHRSFIILLLALLHDAYLRRPGTVPVQKSESNPTFTPKGTIFNRVFLNNNNAWKDDAKDSSRKSSKYHFIYIF
jgi:hypothetical protein